jgi:hypothetical protein
MKFALLYPPLRQARELSRGNRFNHTTNIIQTTTSETGMLLCYELANYSDITVTESKSFRRRRLRCSCQNGRPALSSWKMKLQRRSATRCWIYWGGGGVSRRLWRTLKLWQRRKIFYGIYRTFLRKFTLLLPVGRDTCRYSYSLRASRSGDQIPVGARFSAPVQTGPGAHPSSYTMGNGSLSWG